MRMSLHLKFEGHVIGAEGAQSCSHLLVRSALRIWRHQRHHRRQHRCQVSWTRRRHTSALGSQSMAGLEPSVSSFNGVGFFNGGNMCSDSSTAVADRRCVLALRGAAQAVVDRMCVCRSATEGREESGKGKKLMI
jgi:hypothetical protein